MKLTPGSVGAVALVAVLAMIMGARMYTNKPAPVAEKPAPYLTAPVPDPTPAATPPVVKVEPVEPALAPVVQPAPVPKPKPVAKPKAKPKSKVKPRTKPVAPAAQPQSQPPLAADAKPEANKHLKRRADKGCAILRRYTAKYGADKVREYISSYLPHLQKRADACS